MQQGGGKFAKGPVVEDSPKDIAGVIMLKVRNSVPRNTNIEYFLFVIVKTCSTRPAYSKVIESSEN